MVAVAALVVFVLAETPGSGHVHAHRARNPLASIDRLLRRHHPREEARIARLDAIGDRTIARLLKLGLPVYCGGRRGRDVAFTFDDGPGPYTYLALRKLALARERATFFVVGRNLPLYRGYLRRELRLGAIGDHTFTHPLLTAMPAAAVEAELGRTARAIRSDSGQWARLFRPPYGAHDRTVDRIARRLGLLEILWSIDSRDSLGADWAQIIRNVESALRPGSIVLMHENRGQTIRALTSLLPWLHRHHLRSVSLPELFATDPPSVSQLRRGLGGCGVGGRLAPGSGG